MLSVSTSCSLLNSPENWTYEQPPSIDDVATVQRSLYWCTSIQAAQFMSITGWFSPDCRESDGTTSQGTQAESLTGCRVVEVIQQRVGTSNMKLVRCSAGQSIYWIPLPDHNWI